VQGYFGKVPHEQRRNERTCHEDVMTPMTTRRFHPTRDQVPAARRFVRESVAELGGLVDRRLEEDVALLTSEAVSNAVEHARTDIDVTVERVGPSFLIRVHDDSSDDIHGPAPLGSVAAADGRGIAIIDAVAGGWGVDDIEDDGKTIWFVPTPPGLRTARPKPSPTDERRRR